ncbi:MAG: hypothetical protein P8O14_00885 [SAR86 cluster bacterium]|jgi:hypothetical protein|nr:hypothetical protein [SAR86 cluster bacterium]MDG2092513.1 hypothetical protein [SAR86 cluster bacterium]|tara:strand:- start:202 stop:807 length:606 start_codon:yes stop_codon:yes gene_type:complete
MGILKILFFILVLAVNIEARPISYSGGSTIMIKSDSLSNSTYFHYSPSFKYSIGIENTNNKIFKDNKNYIRFTYLLNRKNALNSQRNLYFQSGIDVGNKNNHFYGAHGDWETRRWFAGFGYKNIQSKTNNDYENKYIQFGVAPYIGDYGDFHTWLMVKTRKSSLTKNTSTYPILKFFSGDALVEVGYDNRTNWDLHLMYRF